MSWIEVWWWSTEPAQDREETEEEAAANGTVTKAGKCMASAGDGNIIFGGIREFENHACLLLQFSFAFSRTLPQSAGWRFPT